MDLREISIFKNLSDDEIKILSAKSQIVEKTYDKGQYIFSFGDESSDIYYLMEGAISVYQIDSSGKRFIFQNFTKPTLFGEVYAYLGEPFDFDCQCQEKSRVLVIKNFRKLFVPPIPENFLISYINFLSKKCLALSKKNQITSQASLRKKIGKFLLENENSNKVELSMKREDLADYLSTTRPSLSRELSKMADEGIIELGSDYIRISRKEDLDI